MPFARVFPSMLRILPHSRDGQLRCGGPVLDLGTCVSEARFAACPKQGTSRGMRGFDPGAGALPGCAQAFAQKACARTTDSSHQSEIIPVILFVGFRYREVA